MKSLVPTIETERVRLRAYREADLAAQAAALGDPEVMRHITGTAHTREESWRKMLAGVGLWGMLGYGYWVVERRSDEVYLGQIGFADFKRQMTPSIEGAPEMGWIFAPHAHGQGYAGEAGRAAVEWADGALGRRELTAIISHDNSPSIRLADRLGFRIREEAQYKEEAVLLFRRPAG
jgi:RimJ/RimL family protein N-acetyltransferase